jgi:hypothetical protein
MNRTIFLEIGQKAAKIREVLAPDMLKTRRCQTGGTIRAIGTRRTSAMVAMLTALAETTKTRCPPQS